MQNDFSRSNLAIRPASRLLSAKANVTPEEIDPNLHGAIKFLENIRGFSDTLDKNTDAFIEEAKRKGQEKAKEFLNDAYLDPNHPKHDEAKKRIDDLKPQVRNFLGVDYWTQQYIYQAQAEEIFNNEQQQLDLEFADKVNLSPTEYYNNLKQREVNFFKSGKDYPAGVQYYLNKMPVKELQDRMRERHIKEVSKQQIATRNTIFSNKAKEQVLQIKDTYNIPTDSKLINATFGSLEPHEKKLLQSRNKGELIPDNKMLDEYEADIISTNREIEDRTSGLLQVAIDAAKAGMQPDEILELTTNLLIDTVKKEPELADEVEMIYKAFIRQGNNNKVLYQETNAWDYIKNNKIEEDGDKAIFTSPIADGYFLELGKAVEKQGRDDEDRLFKSLSNLAERYLRETFPESTALIWSGLGQMEYFIRTGIENGEFTDERKLHEYLATLTQALSVDRHFKDLKETYDKKIALKPLTHEQRQRQQLHLLEAEDKEFKNNKLNLPDGYIDNDMTYEQWLETDEAKKWQRYGFNEEKLDTVYLMRKQASEEYREATKEKSITDTLNKGKYSIKDLAMMVKERPDIVKDITGIEMELINDIPVPKDEVYKRRYRVLLKRGHSAADALVYMKRIENAQKFLAKFNIEE